MNYQHRDIRPEGLTIEEFLAFTATRPSDERWELIEGQPVLNASPVIDHQLIVSNLDRKLWEDKDRLSAPWLPLLGVGMIVPASARSLPQPDLHVLSGRPADGQSHTTDDSLVLIEVLSRSNTRAWRAWRRKVYFSVPNCQHYLTIHTRRREITRYDRADGWREIVIRDDQAAIALPAIGVALTMAEIYRHTTLAD